MTITMEQKLVARLVGACPTHRISVIALRIETTNHTLTVKHTKRLASNSTGIDVFFGGTTLKLQFLKL